jgi:hypothetical protein
MNVLIVPADLSWENRSVVDGYDSPLFLEMWYWAIDLSPLVDEPFYYIVSGPVSPLTLARR